MVLEGDGVGEGLVEVVEGGQQGGWGGCGEGGLAVAEAAGWGGEGYWGFLEVWEDIGDVLTRGMSIYRILGRRVGGLRL